MTGWKTRLIEGYHGTSAAIEFAVTVLKVKALVVMGHEFCGEFELIEA